MTAYLETKEQWAIVIRAHGSGEWHEYARRVDTFEEAHKEGLNIMLAIGMIRTIKVVPVKVFVLKTLEEKWDQPAPQAETDHFEALKDFAETHPGVEVPREQKEINFDDEIPF